MVGVRMLQRRVAVIRMMIGVGVAIVMRVLCEVMINMMIAVMVLSVMVMGMLCCFGPRPVHRGMPRVVVMHVLSTESQRGRDQASNRSHDQRKDQENKDCAAHASTIADVLGL